MEGIANLPNSAISTSALSHVMALPDISYLMRWYYTETETEILYFKKIIM